MIQMKYTEAHSVFPKMNCTEAENARSATGGSIAKTAGFWWRTDLEISSTVVGGCSLFVLLPASAPAGGLGPRVDARDQRGPLFAEARD